jgi:hypothetical protein
MTSVDGLTTYERPDDLWVVTCYYNHQKYASVARNLRTFLAVLEASGMNRLVVECAFGDTPFELAPSPYVVQVRSRDLMWQKERLLNLGIRQLPLSCRKVAWLDCDILFEDPCWAVRTSELLDEFPVVQPFDRSVRLEQGQTRPEGGHETCSFGAVYRRDPTLSRLSNYDRHGHTGFGWAARRGLLDRHGLYDACVAGGGDHVMAHGLCGHSDVPCLTTLVGPGATPRREHFLRWARGIAAEVGGRIAATPGRVMHLWHGGQANRNYVGRHAAMARLGFDPIADLCPGPDGCWEWAHALPDLRRWMADYFRDRREDGDPPGDQAA